MTSYDVAMSDTHPSHPPAEPSPPSAPTLLPLTELQVAFFRSEEARAEGIMKRALAILGRDAKLPDGSEVRVGMGPHGLSIVVPPAKGV